MLNLQKSEMSIATSHFDGLMGRRSDGFIIAIALVVFQVRMTQSNG